MNNTSPQPMPKPTVRAGRATDTLRSAGDRIRKRAGSAGRLSAKPAETARPAWNELGAA